MRIARKLDKLIDHYSELAIARFTTAIELSELKRTIFHELYRARLLEISFDADDPIVWRPTKELVEMYWRFPDQLIPSLEDGLKNRLAN